VSRVLTRDGFTVLEAASGEEAVARAHEFDGTIDLVISDLVMPGMDGRELSRHIGRTRPTIRTILMTGYSDDLPRRAADADADDAEMLHKPFTPAELVRRVRAALSLT
jgi:DNA-binding response OmpR family regulator